MNDMQDLEHHPAAGRNSSELKFPARLHYLLKELKKDGLSEIVSWQPHGRSFLIRDKKRLEQEILPLWFRQTKHHSFLRQLSNYNFRKIHRGPDKGCYFHNQFQRDRPDLSKLIDRVKGNSSPQSDPNFYRISPSNTQLGDSSAVASAAAAPAAAAASTVFSGQPPPPPRPSTSLISFMLAHGIVPGTGLLDSLRRRTSHIQLLQQGHRSHMLTGTSGMAFVQSPVAQQQSALLFSKPFKDTDAVRTSTKDL